MKQKVSSGIKSIITNATGQLSKIYPLLLVIYIPLLSAMVAIIVAFLTASLPPRLFFIDPVTEFNAPMYVGFFSNFGVLLWGAAATICLFSGWLTIKAQGERESAWFLVCAGLVSALLMFDDLYLLHVEVLPGNLRIPKKLVFAAYGGLMLAFLLGFRKTILKTDFILLVIAFTLFGFSMAVDLFVTPKEFVIFGYLPGRHLIEDGPKLLGIATWTTYFVRTCKQKAAPLVGAV